MKVYTSFALLAPLLTLIGATSLPEVTMGAHLPSSYDESIRRMELQRRAADTMNWKRQQAGDIAYCFGRNSICSKANDLYAECRQRDDEERAACKCGNGYVSVEQA